MKPIKFEEANKNLLKPQNMTDEEIADKLARIEAQSQVNTDVALERILNGGA